MKLMEAAAIAENESVCVWNVTNGSRLETYAIRGERDSGTICLNGAAAHLNQPGDIVILATFASYDEIEARDHLPIVVHVDAKNRRVVSQRHEIAGPKLVHAQDAR